MEQILEIVDLTDWKTYREINKEMRKYGIKMNSGNFQKLVRVYNELFYQRADKTFIAHSNKGYMLTKDTSIIKDSLNDYKRRAFAQLKNYWHGMKSIGAQLNLNFDEEFKQYARKE